MLSPGSEDRVLSIDDEETGMVVDAIGTDSARRILAALDDGPMTVADLADETDLTAQNVAYHLGKLTDAGLVGEVESRDAGGNAPSVYALEETTLLSTTPGTTPARSRPGLGALGLAAGALLTLLCLHSLEPSVALVTTILHEFGHLLAAI